MKRAAVAALIAVVVLLAAGVVVEGLMLRDTRDDLEQSQRDIETISGDPLDSPVLRVEQHVEEVQAALDAYRQDNDARVDDLATAVDDLYDNVCRSIGGTPGRNGDVQTCTGPPRS